MLCSAIPSPGLVTPLHGHAARVNASVSLSPGVVESVEASQPWEALESLGDLKAHIGSIADCRVFRVVEQLVMRNQDSRVRL